GRQLAWRPCILQQHRVGGVGKESCLHGDLAERPCLDFKLCLARSIHQQILRFRTRRDFVRLETNPDTNAWRESGEARRIPVSQDGVAPGIGSVIVDDHTLDGSGKVANLFYVTEAALVGLRDEWPARYHESQINGNQGDWYPIETRRPGND